MKNEIYKLDATPSKRIFHSIIADYDLDRSICELVDNGVDVWVRGKRAKAISIHKLVALDNPEARTLIEGMKAERKENGESRFGEKTICEYLKVFAQVIKSAQENGNPIFPRKWNLAFIGLPLVDKDD